MKNPDGLAETIRFRDVIVHKAIRGEVDRTRNSDAFLNMMKVVGKHIAAGYHVKFSVYIDLKGVERADCDCTLPTD